MIQLRMRTKPDTSTSSRSWASSEEGTLLAAALAATLVEYRRTAGQSNERVRSEGPGTNWRTMARLEQLRGQM